MDKFETFSMVGRCENCLCETRSRLNVKLPDILKKKNIKRDFRDRTHAFLCFECVKLHCKTTLSDFWKMFLFPRSKEAIARKKRYK